MQRDYYEHIIRDERESEAIAEYIRNNPSNWRADMDNPANFPQRPPPKTSEEYWRDAGFPRWRPVTSINGQGDPAPTQDE